MTDDRDPLREALKRVAVALKEAEIPFALAGGYAAWALGGPEPDHDADFLVPEELADRAAEELVQRGLEVERPPEDWLFKVWSDGEMVDVLHRGSGASVSQMLEDATEREVISVVMPVLSATDVLVSKLLALDEHYCDLATVLPVVRALREQVDWGMVRERTEGEPFAETVLFLADRLGLTD
jgi:hypothetical protein